MADMDNQAFCRECVMPAYNGMPQELRDLVESVAKGGDIDPAVDDIGIGRTAGGALVLACRSWCDDSGYSRPPALDDKYWLTASILDLSLRRKLVIPPRGGGVLGWSAVIQDGCVTVLWYDCEDYGGAEVVGLATEKCLQAVREGMPTTRTPLEPQAARDMMQVFSDAAANLRRCLAPKSGMLAPLFDPKAWWREREAAKHGSK